jgi:hypothetical protein
MVFQIGAPGARYEPGTAQLARLFGSDEVLGYEASVLKSNPNGGTVNARAVTPDTALVEYLHSHGMRRCPAAWSAAVPSRWWQRQCRACLTFSSWASSSRWNGRPPPACPTHPDVVVLDAPATGHAVRFSPEPPRAAGRHRRRPGAGAGAGSSGDALGPTALPSRAGDDSRGDPVSETVETAHLLEERAGVRLLAVVVNARLPVLARYLPELEAGHLG